MQTIFILLVQCVRDQVAVLREPIIVSLPHELGKVGNNKCGLLYFWVKAKFLLFLNTNFQTAPLFDIFKKFPMYYNQINRETRLRVQM